ncbi:GGDEF domain-containing protein [Alkalinema sp. FACHB-956]|uniref:GGDEF domain-containing protein n=1 Tax=Alkalinema sp. FACHB-956 TaxID=2692768 RepID=UPI0018EF8C04|nr:GGDEF domain-containing protein [Alkalinema sp. FACHB-956]
MIFRADDSTAALKRKASIFILTVMALAGLLATVLHAFEPQPHLLSRIIPPASAIFCFGLLLYLLKVPQQLPLVIKLTLGWSCLIFLLPEYFFVIDAWIHPDRRLVDSFPPISSGLFLLISGIVVFLQPHRAIQLAIALWITIAAPVVIYFSFHLPELSTPRGIDLMITLLPSMAINFTLLLFYSQLQDAVVKLYLERLHFKEVAEKDGLTGIFNRRAGEKFLQTLLDQAEASIGIILCDVDHFKQVNDRYGHLVGDRVLQAIAHCCQTHLRKQDIFSRWGGEEFLVVVPGETATELLHLADRLRMVIANHPIPEVGHVTASFGVAVLQHQETLAQLFDRADQALYQAKRLGRDRVMLAPASQPVTSDRSLR